MLIDLLADEDDEVCFAACNALHANGTAARQAVPALVKMLGHSSIFYRRNASRALAAIGPDASAINPLSEALKEEDSWVNYYAAIAVGKLGPQGKPAAPALLDLMKSKRATQEMVPDLPGFQVDKRGQHIVIEIKPGVPRLPGTGTVGYAAFWALLQIDAELAKDALPP